MRSLYPPCFRECIRVGVIHPWFADTALVPLSLKVGLAGVPLTPVERIAKAIIHAAADPDMETSGCPWLLPDDGYVFRLEREQLREGVYKMIDDRTKVALKLAFPFKCTFRTLIGQRNHRGVQGFKHSVSTIRDLWKFFGKQTILAGLMFGVARYLYKRMVKA